MLIYSYSYISIHIFIHIGDRGNGVSGGHFSEEQKFKLIS